MRRNGWTKCVGISGRHPSEWVDGMRRNGKCVGISSSGVWTQRDRGRGFFEHSSDLPISLAGRRSARITVPPVWRRFGNGRLDFDEDRPRPLEDQRDRVYPPGRAILPSGAGLDCPARGLGSVDAGRNATIEPDVPGRGPRHQVGARRLGPRRRPWAPRPPSLGRPSSRGIHHPHLTPETTCSGMGDRHGGIADRLGQESARPAAPSSLRVTELELLPAREPVTGGSRRARLR